MELTPLERTNRHLAGEPVDRAPNQNILMAFAARYIGSTYDRLAQDYRVLVEGNLRACEAFGIDMLSAISDPLREASAFGAPVVFPYDAVPMCPEPPLAAAFDLDRCDRGTPGRRSARAIGSWRSRSTASAWAATIPSWLGEAPPPRPPICGG